MDRSLREELMEQVDAEWSETVRHLPLADGCKDIKRGSLEFTAVLRTGDRSAEKINYGSVAKSKPSLATGGGYLRINRAEHASLVVRKGDKFLALDRDGSPIFEVLSVDDRSHLRLICELGEVN